MIQPPSELIDFLKESDDFIIATHISPDGDGLGSSLALSELLKAKGKKTLLLTKEPYPRQYSFLPGIKEFITLNDYLNIQNKPRNLILVDCQHIKRIGIEDCSKSLVFSKTVIIDHHEVNNPCGDIFWIEAEAPATGMMIFSLVKEMGLSITPEMAINLYAAIAFDTGNFRFENVTPETFRVAAELIEAGAKPSLIYTFLYERWSLGRLRLLTAMLETLELESGLAMGTITRKMFSDTATTEDDIESFVSFLRILDNVNVSVIITEIDKDFFRVSLRSKQDLDVSKIAKDFGGGGHKNAAGFRIKGDLIPLKEKIKAKVRYYK
ncbi:MAG: bifunctional oligoribonuclease/PAP phosphatase NrnA [Thermodesulfovibrionales bacterium]|nr:bifunctional oligoribonuclease/PAP phosphatase NrnA [Thermodesulfovibrionales bacterium]